MNNALRRLRSLFGDPLFVHRCEGMSPTPRALGIGPTITAALDSIRSSVSTSAFDPCHSAARFVIGTLDYMEALYFPALVERMGITGSEIKLHIRRLPTLFEVPQRALELGTIDCALGLFPQPMTPQSSLHAQIIGQDDWVCMARRGHPAFRSRLTLRAYAGLRHLRIVYPDANDGRGMVDRHLAIPVMECGSD